MNSVSRLGRVIMSMRSRAAGVAGTASPTSTRPATQSRHNAQADREQLRVDVAQRLQSIDLDVLAGRRQAVRVFLQLVLVNELGEGMMRSPRFVEMLGEIQGVIEADPQVHGDLVALLHELKAEA